MRQVYRKFGIVCVIIFLGVFLTACSTKISFDYSKTSDQTTSDFVSAIQSRSTAHNYVGKNIKIRGKYLKAGNDYHYIKGLNSDPCCNWNLEIRLAGDGLKLPSVNNNIIIVGKYLSERKGGVTIYWLDVFEMN